MKPTVLEPTPILDAPSPSCGLGGLLALVDGAKRALPLAEVKVGASIAGGCCCTVIEQRFRNDYERPLEAVHIFPLPEDGAVVELELVAGDLTIRGECKEREEAAADFAQARAEGHRAALLDQERDDVHTLRVTNLPPQTEVVVRLTVVERLALVDGRFRWRFPTVIAPRFLPGVERGHDGPGALPDTDRVPDASKLQPPLRLEGGTTLELQAEIEGPVSRLQSSLHALSMSLESGRIRVAPSGKATLNKDFVLSFACGAPEATSAQAWTDGKHTLVQVNPPSAALPQALPRDAVFVVDISGSMRGSKMRAAKDALHAALHGLVDGDRFLLIAFDDRLERFDRGFRAYDAASLQEADAWIARLAARGGTEMLPAAQAALEGETPDGRLRTVLFITDGQAWNEGELVPAVAKRRKGARFFTLGIGTAVNAALLKTLARVGGGTCELTTPDAAIEETVARLEARFGSPLTDGVKVEGMLAARPEPATVFLGRPASLFVEGAPESLRVVGREAGGSLKLTVRPQRVSFPLGALWARERVAYLQDRLLLKPYEEEALKPDIIAVSLEHRIASRFTSFVAVDRSSKVHTGSRVEVVQPAELPEDWDASFKGGPAVGGAITGALRLLSAAPASVPPPASFAPSPAADRDDFGGGPRMRSRGPGSGGAPSAPADRSKRRGGGFFSRLFGGSSKSESFSVGMPPKQKKKRKPAKVRVFDADGAPEARSAPAPSSPPAELGAILAREQRADGSFGGDVRRTAAAVLALVLLGHTRRSGRRSRVLLKAFRWLEGRTEPEAVLARNILQAAEAGQTPTPDAAWRKLCDALPEGKMLAAALAG